MSTVPYLFAEAVFGALEAHAHFSGAKVINNPTNAASLLDGERVVFVEDGDDELVSVSGLKEDRLFLLTVGVISRAAAARQVVDADQLAAVAVVHGQLQALVALGAVGVRHTRTARRLEGIDVGGALRLCTFELKYRAEKPTI